VYLNLLQKEQLQEFVFKRQKSPIAYTKKEVDLLPDESLTQNTSLLSNLIPNGISDFGMSQNQLNILHQNFNQLLMGNFQNFSGNFQQGSQLG
jgi:hypothetical protein